MQWCATTVALAALLVCAARGAAQRADPSVVQAAGEQTVDSEYEAAIATAVREYEAGNWPEALAMFEQAHALRPSARTLRGMGVAAFESRRYARAIAYLRQALSAADLQATIGDEATALHRLHARAQRYVGRLVLVASGQGPAPTDPRVWIDSYPAVVVDGEVLVDPGEHELRVEAEGYLPIQRSLVIDPSHRVRLRLSWVAAPAAPTAKPPSPRLPQPAAVKPPPQARATTQHAPDSAPGRDPLAVSLLVAGGAALAGAAGAGLWALSTAERSRRACDDEACHRRATTDYGRAQDIALAADVLLLAGGVGLATGLVLLLSRQDRPEGRAKPRVALRLGVGRIGVGGTL